jgi:hypothetical protein
MSKSFPGWTRYRCRHPNAHVIRTAGGRVLRDVCTSCGAELGAVVFNTSEDALDALRDAVLSGRPDPPADEVWADYRRIARRPVETIRETTFLLPADRTEPYDVSIPGQLLQMSPAQWWPGRRSRE